MNKKTIAIFLIVLGISAGIIKKFQSHTVIDNDDISILNIEKPSQAIIGLVTPISSIIKDPTDRAKLAIFNQEFASRVKNYRANSQEINDVYVLAAKDFFKGSLVNKYDNLDTMVVSLFELLISGENHEITEEEKTKLSETFSGLAWSLTQK